MKFESSRCSACCSPPAKETGLAVAAGHSQRAERCCGASLLSKILMETKGRHLNASLPQTLRVNQGGE